MPTEEGIPLLGLHDGDPEQIRQHIERARVLPDEEERAARLFFLGMGLLGDLDRSVQQEGAAVLSEASQLGSPQAQFELARWFLAVLPEDDEVEASDMMLRAASLLWTARDANFAPATVLLDELAEPCPVCAKPLPFSGLPASELAPELTTWDQWMSERGYSPSVLDIAPLNKQLGSCGLMHLAAAREPWIPMLVIGDDIAVHTLTQISIALTHLSATDATTSRNALFHPFKSFERISVLDSLAWFVRGGFVCTLDPIVGQKRPDLSMRFAATRILVEISDFFDLLPSDDLLPRLRNKIFKKATQLVATDHGALVLKMPGYSLARFASNDAAVEATMAQLATFPQISALALIGQDRFLGVRDFRVLFNRKAERPLQSELKDRFLFSLLQGSTRKKP